MKDFGKKSRARLGKHLGQVASSSLPLLGVWLCNGLWHGTGWNYIFFGLYYFILILFENLTEPWIESLAKKLKINRNSLPYRSFQSLKLLFIVFTGELFFRAADLTTGFLMVRSIFTDFHWSTLTDGSLLGLGLSLPDYAAVFLGFIAVLAVGIIHERGISIRSRIADWNIKARWGFLYAAIFVVIIFGAYGDGYLPVKLIYAGF